MLFRSVVGASPVLLEKSPPNITKIWWLRKTFKNSKFIILSRDPRAVSGATQKWSRTSLPDLMMHWNVAYSRALADYREEDCLIVRYEDLCENVSRELGRISEFVGIPLRSFSDSEDSRFKDLTNQNGEYLKLHACRNYGTGVWGKFGYEV